MGSASMFGEYNCVFNECPLLSVMMVEPEAGIDVQDDGDKGGGGNGNGNGNGGAAGGGVNATSAIIKAFNEQGQLPAVVKIWATNTVIASLKGPFKPYQKFADLPRAMRIAPDAKTWAAVQLWLWWLPPTAFISGGDARVVCKSRRVAIWTALLSGYRGEKFAILPRLPEELWLYMFGFLKHDRLPAF